MKLHIHPNKEAFFRFQKVSVGLAFDLLTFALRYAGQVGYVIAGMKEVKEAQIGDTLYHQKQPVEPLLGFKPAKAMVFAGVSKSVLMFVPICVNQSLRGRFTVL